MITRTGGVTIDSIAAAEGEFTWFQWQGGRPLIKVKLAYVAKDTQTTLGYCDISQDLLSQSTIDAFKEFIQGVEEDFGIVIFDGMQSIEVSDTSLPAGSPHGLQKGLGE